jgi:tetratricopeptide (TPR) repeat protein
MAAEELGSPGPFGPQSERCVFAADQGAGKDPNNPETLTELALSYSASNDFHQALEHLNKALENRARLSSPDLEYTILYQLADIYLQNRSSQTYIIDYERILLEITGRDEDFSSQENFQRNLRDSIQEVLLTPRPRGGTSLDRMVTLYRMGDSFSLRAHVLLGEFYVHSGRYNEAVDHLSFAVLKMYSLLIEKLREEDPLFAFETSAELFEIVRRNPQWIQYLVESEFDKALYYLGSAAYGISASPAVYRGIWETVLIVPFDSGYRSRSRAMLAEPGLEEILYGSQQFRDEVNAP